MMQKLHQKIEILHRPPFEKALPRKLGGSNALSNPAKKITNKITKIAKIVQIGVFYKKTDSGTIGVLNTKNFESVA